MADRRLHHKNDGWMLVLADGRCRYLTFWETAAYVTFGVIPNG